MQHQLVDVTNLAVNDLLGSVLTADPSLSPARPYRPTSG